MSLSNLYKPLLYKHHIVISILALLCSCNNPNVSTSNNSPNNPSNNKPVDPEPNAKSKEEIVAEAKAWAEKLEKDPSLADQWLTAVTTYDQGASSSKQVSVDFVKHAKEAAQAAAELVKEKKDTKSFILASTKFFICCHEALRYISTPHSSLADPQQFLKTIEEDLNKPWHEDNPIIMQEARWLWALNMLFHYCVVEGFALKSPDQVNTDSPVHIQLAKLANEKWSIIFSSGYKVTEEDKNTLKSIVVLLSEALKVYHS